MIDYTNQVVGNRFIISNKDNEVHLIASMEKPTVTNDNFPILITANGSHENMFDCQHCPMFTESLCHAENGQICIFGTHIAYDELPLQIQREFRKSVYFLPKFEVMP